MPRGSRSEVSAPTWFCKAYAQAASYRRPTVMSERRVLTEDDEGKPIVTTEDEEVGRVIEVTDGVAYVNPDPDTTETIRAKDGRGNKYGEETYSLFNDSVEMITDDEVRLTSTS